MIAVILSDLRWRIGFLFLLAIGLYFLEPGFHQHEGRDLQAIALGPLGVAGSTLAYFSGISMIVLLGGFVSGERRGGHTRLYFSQPTSPLAFFGLRWGLAFAVALSACVVFLVVGQLIAWGQFEGGWGGLVVPVLSALIYGSLIAFLSVTLPRADGLIVFLLFLPTFIPQSITFALSPLAPPIRRALMFLLPPHGALQAVYEGVLLGRTDWGAIAFAAGYSAVFLFAATVILRLREWP